MRNLFILLVLFVGLPIVTAAECSGSVQDCIATFRSNPTAAQLSTIAHPTLELFTLLDHQERKLYLQINPGQSELEEAYLQTEADFHDETDRDIAKRFFTQSSDQVNTNRDLFLQYLREGEQIDVVSIAGAIRGFAADGTLQGANQQININDFKEGGALATAYRFGVDESGDIRLMPRTADHTNAPVVEFHGALTPGTSGTFALRTAQGPFETVSLNGIALGSIATDLRISPEGIITGRTTRFENLYFAPSSGSSSDNIRALTTPFSFDTRTNVLTLNHASLATINGDNGIYLRGSIFLHTSSLPDSVLSSSFPAGSFSVKEGTELQVDGLEVDATHTDVQVVFSRDAPADLSDFFQNGIIITPQGYAMHAEHPYDVRVAVSGRTLGYTMPTSALSPFSLPERGWYQRGDIGPEVERIQNELIATGYLDPKYGDPRNGYGKFGPKTQEALARWQSQHQLTPDGLFGKETATLFTQTPSAQNGLDTQALRFGLTYGDVRVFQNRETGRIALDVAGVHTFQLGSREFLIRPPEDHAYLTALSISDSLSGKSFKVGDTGDSVRLIQRLVGVSETGTYDDRTERAVRDWQRTQGLDPDGYFGKKSLTAALSNDPLLYKRIRSALITSEMGVPFDLTLRDAQGHPIDYLLPAEGPGLFETLGDYVSNGVRNAGYFTSLYKTAIHVNTVLFDNLPQPGSLTGDHGIESNTVVSPQYLDQMERYLREIDTQLDNADDRFNLVVRKAGEVTSYNPEIALRLISIFGSRYKDLSPDFTGGYGNRQLVNGQSSERYKITIPKISDADPFADKRYRLITVSGEYLYDPEGFARATQVGLEHTSYEALALGGRIIREAKTGRRPAYGSGDVGDAQADFAAVRFAKALRENPVDTLKYFEFNRYFPVT